MSLRVVMTSNHHKRDIPYVRTSPNGRINFSVAAYRALGSPTAVEVLLDKTTRKLGFRPAIAGGRAWHVSISNGNSAASISCSRVLETLRLRARTYSFPAILEHGILLIDASAVTTFPELQLIAL